MNINLVSALAVASFAATVVSSCSTADSGQGTADTNSDADGALPDTQVDVGADADTGLGGEPDFDWPASQFRVEVASWGVTLVGSVLDGPQLVFHEEAERLGACRLLTYQPSVCADVCPGLSQCIDGSCQSPPSMLSAGTLVLSGLGGGQTANAAQQDTGSYWFQTESFTAATVDAALVLTSPGDDTDPFELSATVAVPPTPVADWAALLGERGAGGDVTLTWSDATPGARIYLRMTTGIGTHGGISPVEIECEGPDTGSLRLPGTYLDALYAQGWSCGECGGNDLWRYNSAVTASGDLSIQLRVSARTSFWFHPNTSF